MVEGSSVITCPLCRQTTPVPDKGISDLTSDFRANDLIAIMDDHKKEIASQNRSDSSCKPEVLRVDEARLESIFCSGHSRREVELFCEECQQLICLECVIKGSMHHDHEYKRISESHENFSKKVEPLLDEIENKLAPCAGALTAIDSRVKEITDQKIALKDEIAKSSRQLHDIVDERQTKLTAQVDQISSSKLKRLETQKEQIEKFSKTIDSSLESTRAQLKAGFKNLVY